MNFIIVIVAWHTHSLPAPSLRVCVSLHAFCMLLPTSSSLSSSCYMAAPLLAHVAAPSANPSVIFAHLAATTFKLLIVFLPSMSKHPILSFLLIWLEKQIGQRGKGSSCHSMRCDWASLVSEMINQ